MFYLAKHYKGCIIKESERELKIMILKEACVENFTTIPKAIENGAGRIELCDNLAVGGTTVSYGVMQQAQSYCAVRGIPVMAIIRARGGDFVYNDIEVATMLMDIDIAKKLNVAGVVFGALTIDGWIDEVTVSKFIRAATGIQMTFHMAFDAIAEERKLAAIDWLVEHGVQRILTHGGKASTPISETTDKIAKYAEYAGNRIIILPGGGITTQNLPDIQKKLPMCTEFHGTKIV